MRKDRSGDGVLAYKGATGAWRDRLKVLAAVLTARLSSAPANLEYLVVMGTNCA